MSIRTVLTTMATLGLLLAGQAAVGSAVYAHTVLSSSVPADGAVLAEVPTEVSLMFSDDLAADLTQVVVTDSGGATWHEGQPTTEGSSVRQRLRPFVPSGVLDVAWRVVAADGHPISGTSTFTVSALAPADTAATASPEAPATPSTGTEGAPSSDLLPTGAASAAPGPSSLVLGGGMLAGAAALAVVSVALRRRRSAGAERDE